MNPGTPKKKVLIVDDQKDLSSLFKIGLEAEGFEVMFCDNAETALQQAREFRPDLILLDLMMPRLSGFDAIELFRSILETKAVKIVIFSALDRPEDIERVKKLGADDYIVKSSMQYSDVIARIKTLITDSDDMELPSSNSTLKS
jgi:DNA-binding response OmpR family regulator